MASARQYNTAISIHALREEGDDDAELTMRTAGDFYPRPP